MSIDEVLEVIRANRIIAIVRLNDLSTAIDLTHALLDGGIRALEFTLSNPAAIKAMADVKAAVPEFDRGDSGDRHWHGVECRSGTHRLSRPARSSSSSPTTNCQTIEVCKQMKVAVMPGAFTPTEILAAWEAGAQRREGVSGAIGRAELSQGRTRAAAVFAPDPDRRDRSGATSTSI